MFAFTTLNVKQTNSIRYSKGGWKGDGVIGAHRYSLDEEVVIWYISKMMATYL
jgi:hypothetical protein